MFGLFSVFCTLKIATMTRNITRVISSASTRGLGYSTSHRCTFFGGVIPMFPRFYVPRVQRVRVRFRVMVRVRFRVRVNPKPNPNPNHNQQQESHSNQSQANQRRKRRYYHPMKKRYALRILCSPVTYIAENIGPGEHNTRGTQDPGKIDTLPFFVCGDVVSLIHEHQAVATLMPALVCMFNKSQ